MKQEDIEKKAVAKALNMLKKNEGNIKDHIKTIFDSDFDNVSIGRYRGRPGVFKELYACKYDMSEISYYKRLDSPDDIEDDEFIFMVNNKIWFYNEPDVIDYRPQYNENKGEKMKNVEKKKTLDSGFKSAMKKVGITRYTS